MDTSNDQIPVIEGQKMVPGPNGEMVLAVTGHRPSKLGGYGESAYTKLVLFARKVLDQLEPIRVITGMALGWDQAIAQACVDLKIPFSAAVPFNGQELTWPRAAQDRYHRLLGQAQEVVIVSDGDYAPEKMQVRNQWMVDNCDVLLALYDGSSGGTANCVRYAEGKSVPVINIWSSWTKE
jgi:uncharacterized phage-like protein YoqJ